MRRYTVALTALFLVLGGCLDNGANSGELGQGDGQPSPSLDAEGGGDGEPTPEPEPDPEPDPDPQSCEPYAQLECFEGVEAFFEGESQLSGYGCSDGEWDGPDFVYELYFPQNMSAWIIIETSFEDLGIFLLAGECHPEACIQQLTPWGNDEPIAFEGDTPYFLVIEAPPGSDFDPDQLWFFAWIECGAYEECGDGYDNDGDGQVDCADADCEGVEPCQPLETACADGFDNDGDGQTDCADNSCAAAEACEPTESSCFDGFDNDGDGVADCADVDCADVDGCEPGGEVSCFDGLDNDGDGATDCADAQCAVYEDCVGQCAATPIPLQCGGFGGADGEPFGGVSGIDNYSCSDGSKPGAEVVFEFTPEWDMTANFWAYAEPFDATSVQLLEGSCDGSACIAASQGFDGGYLSQPLKAGTTYYMVIDSSSTQPLYVYEVSLECSEPEDCTDGYDNDWDGKADCADLDCLKAGPPCEPAEATCDDGLDNDGDYYVDCADANCQLLGDPCEEVETHCADGIDNDGDGLTDCGEPACKGQGACETVEQSCDDGVDNDGDGWTDCEDGSCAVFDYCAAFCGGGALELKCYEPIWGEPQFSEQSFLSTYDCLDGEFPGWESVYTFTPTSDMVVTMGTFAEPWGATSLAVLEGSCESGACVAAASPGEGDEYQQLTAELVGGVTYYFVVDSVFEGPVFTYEGYLECN